MRPGYARIAPAGLWYDALAGLSEIDFHFYKKVISFQQSAISPFVPEPVEGFIDGLGGPAAVAYHLRANEPIADF
ncbi:MAG: hypothetical protein ABS46_11720 [Cytophagaceae bacterium SCN 52-12]|nr:MAG: hypothetical protein ABS46_11720 [Cytophagaceae bacterium SCN 52-12]